MLRRHQLLVIRIAAAGINTTENGVEVVEPSTRDCPFWGRPVVVGGHEEAG